MRPVVCVYSDCQGESLIGLLRSHPDFAESEFVFLRAWLKDSPPEFDSSRHFRTAAFNEINNLEAIFAFFRGGTFLPLT